MWLSDFDFIFVVAGAVVRLSSLIVRHVRHNTEIRSINSQAAFVIVNGLLTDYLYRLCSCCGCEGGCRGCSISSPFTVSVLFLQVLLLASLLACCCIVSCLLFHIRHHCSIIFWRVMIKISPDRTVISCVDREPTNWKSDFCGWIHQRTNKRKKPFHNLNNESESVIMQQQWIHSGSIKGGIWLHKDCSSNLNTVQVQAYCVHLQKVHPTDQLK